MIGGAGVHRFAIGAVLAALAVDAGSVQASADPSAVSCTDCVPALTPVELMIDAHLGSKLSTTGAVFPLHLAKPIVIAGREVVAAGAVGEGEVIHAKKAGGMGAAGELVLAARFITVDGRPLRLRSMRMAMAGKDAIHTVDTINAASAASLLPIGLVGFFMSGRNVVVTKGTVAEAKTAADFPLSPPGPDATAAPKINAEPAPADPAKQGE
ncbi:hypothetical protein [Novosphingobium sp. TH158]|uniref:hypothetical protein n=1 Tax=Novosphingobium sp. TH158 TaxID=2067455 RepID=UPI000C7D7653|nr:hypothetical protein [Novosphingobium sp. TH158]PLK25605.1 hypothetical protein C0V78_00880 [Novosphingobium sp. TH158]